MQFGASICLQHAMLSEELTQQSMNARTGCCQANDLTSKDNLQKKPHPPTFVVSDVKSENANAKGTDSYRCLAFQFRRFVVVFICFRLLDIVYVLAIFQHKQR